MESFAKIQEEAIIVNERVTMLKDNDRVLAIQSTLEGYTADGGLLFQPHRRFVLEGVILALSSSLPLPPSSVIHCSVLFCFWLCLSVRRFHADDGGGEGRKGFAFLSVQ